MSTITAAPAAAAPAPSIFAPPGKDAPAVVHVTDVARPGTNYVINDNTPFSAGNGERFSGAFNDALSAAREMSYRFYGDEPSHTANAIGVFNAGDGAFQLRPLWHASTDYATTLTIDGPANFFEHLDRTLFTRTDDSLVAVVGGRNSVTLNRAGRGTITWNR